MQYGHGFVFGVAAPSSFIVPPRAALLTNWPLLSGATGAVNGSPPERDSMHVDAGLAEVAGQHAKRPIANELGEKALELDPKADASIGRFHGKASNLQCRPV